MNDDVITRFALHGIESLYALFFAGHGGGKLSSLRLRHTLFVINVASTIENHIVA